MSFQGGQGPVKTNLLALVLLGSALGAGLLLRLALLQESLRDQNIVLGGNGPARSD
jgi:hypothetical protein